MKNNTKATCALVMDSPMGPLTLVGNGKALTEIRMDQKPKGTPKVTYAPGAKDAILLKTKKQLQDYFAGKLSKFNVPMETDGTAFQKKVWRALTKIPFGKTVSYKDI
ncbi:MAG: glycosyltransferase, partial [Alphaproteobacteria bacterium]|nr:glycosyltransferase [Alphaproteobacteria bacterium]